MDHMKAMHLLVLALAWSFTARADFRYTVSEHNAYAMAISGAPDPQVTRYYLKGYRVLSESGDVTRIIDLNAQTDTVINKAAKTYSVRNLPEKPDQARAAMGLHRQIGMKETGEQKTINAYGCRQIIVTLFQSAPPPIPSGHTAQIEIDAWISSDVPGWKNMRAFEQNNGSPFFVSAARQNGFITEFLKLSDMSGFPVQAVIRVSEGGLTPAQVARTRTPLERIIETGGQRAEAAKEALAHMSSLANGDNGIEITQVYSDFSDAEVPDAIFNVPADFTRTDAAIRSAQNVLEHGQSDIGAGLIEAAALIVQGKLGEARQELEPLLKAHPSSPDVLFETGVLNLYEKKYKDAEDAFRRSYQVNPANLRGLMGVVRTYLAQNKVDQAIQELRVESAKAPARADLHQAIGEVCVNAGRFDMAIAEYQTALASTAKGSTSQGEAYLHIGDAQRRKGDLDAAIVSLQAARQTLPDNHNVLSALALTLENAGRWPEAKQVYQAVTRVYPNDYIALNNLAFGMAEHPENSGDLDQALSMAQRARQLLTTPVPEISDTLGWIYLKKNLPDNALEIFRDLVAKQPHHSTYRLHLGMALAMKGEKTEALDQLREALKDGPNKGEQDEILRMIADLGLQ
jgi:tetratricopeptide (TPR) repeat protein